MRAKAMVTVWVRRDQNGKIIGGYYSRPPTDVIVEAIDDQSAEFVAFDKPAKPLPLDLLQSRIEAEIVGGNDGWTVYDAYMFGTAGRRKAFTKIMFAGKPLPPDHAGLRTTLSGAGFSAAAIDRITASPNGGG
jgi:hypothetical protein